MLFPDSVSRPGTPVQTHSSLYTAITHAIDGRRPIDPKRAAPLQRPRCTAGTPTSNHEYYQRVVCTLELQDGLWNPSHEVPRCQAADPTTLHACTALRWGSGGLFGDRPPTINCICEVTRVGVEMQGVRVHASCCSVCVGWIRGSCNTRPTTLMPMRVVSRQAGGEACV